MTASTLERLETLARTDPAVAPLAELQAVVLRAAAEPTWSEGVPELPASRLAEGLPLLQGATLVVDSRRLRDLLRALGTSAGVGKLPSALAAPELDPLELVQAAIVQDAERLTRLAARLNVDAAALGVIAGLAALPLLHACGRRAEPLLASAAWERGACPVCAAWPTLVEMRGLERQLVLRCGRCGAGWTSPHQRCVFCDNRDHHSLAYFAPEQEREARRAATCDACRGYVKVLATLKPLDPVEILLQDLSSLELDLAVLEQAYARPSVPAFRLDVRLEPRRRRGWPGWLR